MNFTKGQTLGSGFTILDIVELAEMKATGIWAKHQCGAEVFHAVNDDSENLFAFAFATIPEDNTGAAHILEHSVLCGSRRYPLKDAFLVLAQGSLQTFLNAWTFPDKTVYPASSVNEHDYFNLMSVYGDAVFNPLLSRWTFMQEGCRFEFENKDAQSADKDSRLSITGVVYNEMKGAYSTPDTYINHWSVKAVLPDTPYRFESGGDPEHIPDLNWEGLRNFHSRRYSPANCRIFLAGNIPTEKQLAFLNDQFFSSSGASAARNVMGNIPRIEKQKRWMQPKELHVPCPCGGDTKPTAFLSWLCSGINDVSGSAANENIALAALVEILLGHDGSPLMRVLIESGLGEDITPASGIEYEIGETLIIAGLRGMKGNADNSPAEEAGRQLESLVMNELRRLVAEGIPKGEIEAALLNMEFSQREIRRSGGPFSLVWMRRSLKSWIHGGTPWESLLLEPALNELKKNIGTNDRYFESLIQQYLLDNPHRALVTVEPREDFLPNQQAKFAEMLQQKEQALSADERQNIVNDSITLENIQSGDDSPEALASIPHLSRKDLSDDPDLIPRRFEHLNGIPVISHDLHTNGITYADIAFPLSTLPQADYLWLPFFTRAVTSVGLPGMDYAEVSSLLARTVGGLNAILHTGSVVPGLSAPDDLALASCDWLSYRLKCLDEKTAPSLDLVLRLICEADFSDARRIRDLVLEMKNDIRSSLAPAGHKYASTRANRFLSASSNVEELWHGLIQLEFAHTLAEMDTAEVISRLQRIRDTIASCGLIANLAGSAQALKSGGAELAKRFSSFGAPRKGSGIRDQGSGSIVREQSDSQAYSDSQHQSPFPDPRSPIPSSEVFASPSLQIGFAAMSMQAAAFDTVGQVAETVLAHQLSTGALWEVIRMKGGAYGAFASSDCIERCFSLATYRDPSPFRSLETFASVLKSGADDFLTEDELEKTIIGCYARETRPRTPSEKSFIDLLRFLSRIDDGSRRRKLERLISVSTADISAALANLASQAITGQVIITGTKDAEQAAAALGVEVKQLPV